MSVTVSWGRRKLPIRLAVEGPMTLRELTRVLSAETAVPEDRIKLTFAGVLMKDPSASLESYGIRAGSNILMMGSTATVPSSPSTSVARSTSPTRATPKPAPKPVDEGSLVAGLAGALDGYRASVLPVVEAYQDLAAQLLARKTPSPDLSPKALHTAYARASEYCLQTLLKIDGVSAPPGFEGLRAKRKEAVRLVQGWLDDLDKTKALTAAHFASLGEF